MWLGPSQTPKLLVGWVALDFMLSWVFRKLLVLVIWVGPLALWILHGPLEKLLGPCFMHSGSELLLQAAARHHCWYLVNLHMLQFLRVGGDPQWLRGLDFIPPKLRNLNEINKILAHRPWLISKEHIEVTARGTWM